MALIQCSECGSEMPGTAGACPTCGHRLPVTWRAIWPTLSQFVWPVFALVLMLGGGAFLRRTMRADIARRHADEHAALGLSISAAEACEQIVMNNLQSPATAAFNAGSGGYIQMPSGDSILVLGTVDAANRSGQIVRTRYSCGLRRDSTKGVWVGSASIAAPITSRRQANVVPK